MILKKSISAGKYFHISNHCHGYEDIFAGKEKIQGFFQNMISKVLPLFSVYINCNLLSTSQKTSRRPLSDFKTQAESFESDKGRTANLLMYL